MVVQVGRDAGNEDSAEHAHVQGLDVGNHGQARAGTGVLTIVDAEVAAVKGQDTGDEIVEYHVDDETFHGTAGLFFLGKANGNGDGKEDRHLIEDGPGALLDDVPEIIPEVPFSARLPKRPVLPKMIDKATVSPKKANKMTGVYIAPPKRCSSCITRSLLNDIDNSSRL